MLERANSGGIVRNNWATVRRWFGVLIRPQSVVGLVTLVFFGGAIPGLFLKTSVATISMSASHWLAPSLNAQPGMSPQISDSVQRERSAQQVVPHVSEAVDCNTMKCIALTFDDGPDFQTTPKVLAALEHARVTASFFVVGSRIAGNQSLLERMYHDNDEIGNHSWSHPDMTTLSSSAIQRQVVLTEQAVVAAGVPAPNVFRPPYGAVDASVRANVPLALMLWNEDPQDWAATTPKQIAASVIASAKPGGVVDMHDIYASTAAALPTIITRLKAEHYHFVTVNQLMQLKPGLLGQYYGRLP